MAVWYGLLIDKLAKVGSWRSVNYIIYLLQLQVAYSKGLLKGKTTVESEAKKSFINNVVCVEICVIDSSNIVMQITFTARFVRV